MIAGVLEHKMAELGEFTIHDLWPHWEPQATWPQLRRYIKVAEHEGQIERVGLRPRQGVRPAVLYRWATR